MKRRLALAYAVLGSIVAAGAPVRAADGFADWGAIVVAGDWHSQSGAPSEVFDNARRDVSAGFERIGVKPDNLLEFSVRPERYPGAHPLQSDGQTIASALWDLTNRTSAGCLVYFSSHGTLGGLILGDSLLEPKTLETILNNTCADRPTVAIVSACFSGVFVPALKGPNRFVLTAARPDRSSFGCGDNDKYTFFDDCVLQSLPRSKDFPGLAGDVRACVSRREREGHFSPPSDPQLSVGASVATALPHW